jgi:DNA-binding transcriptional LysR family regulator
LPHADVLAGAAVDLSLHALRSFVAVAEERQFGRAAARLHLSASALSEMVSRTEKTLGARLFVRTPRGVELTDTGRELLPLAHAVVAAGDAVADWVAARSTAQRGRVRVGLAGPAIAPLRARVLDHLRQRHPDIDVVTRRRSQRREAFADLRSGRLDVAYVPDVPGDSPGLRTMTVGHESRVLAVPAGHPLGASRSVALEETNGETFLTVAGNDPRAVTQWLVDPRSDGSHPARGAEAGDFDDLLDLVAAGRGIAMAGAADEQQIARKGIAWVALTDAPQLRVAVGWRADERNPAVLAYLSAVHAVTAEAT